MTSLNILPKPIPIVPSKVALSKPIRRVRKVPESTPDTRSPNRTLGSSDGRSTARTPHAHQPESDFLSTKIENSNQYLRLRQRCLAQRSRAMQRTPVACVHVLNCRLDRVTANQQKIQPFFLLDLVAVDRLIVHRVSYRVRRRRSTECRKAPGCGRAFAAGILSTRDNRMASGRTSSPGSAGENPCGRRIPHLKFHIFPCSISAKTLLLNM